jgi:hypothetical protein
LKTSLKCDEDFILVSDEAWEYLNKAYGGNDFPRYSIEVASGDPETMADSPTQDKEYIVEVFYKRL